MLCCGRAGGGLERQPDTNDGGDSSRSGLSLGETRVILGGPTAHAAMQCPAPRWLPVAVRASMARLKAGADATSMLVSSTVSCARRLMYPVSCVPSRRLAKSLSHDPPDFGGGCRNHRSPCDLRAQIVICRLMPPPGQWHRQCGRARLPFPFANPRKPGGQGPRRMALRPVEVGPPVGPPEK
jgi:hypothetical protein